MSVHAVVAVRGGPEAKSRCAAVLDGPQRETLVMAMIDDMLGALARVDTIDHRYVVTPTPEIAERASRLGAIALLEPRPLGLNAALEWARSAIVARDAEARLLMLPGDLPLLDPAELVDIIASFPRDRVVLAPTDDGGTGALLLPARANYDFSFGPCSAARHREAGARAGIEVIPFLAPSLALDIDTVADIHAVRRRGIDSHTVRYLRRLELAEELAGR